MSAAGGGVGDVSGAWRGDGEAVSEAWRFVPPDGPPGLPAGQMPPVDAERWIEAFRALGFGDAVVAIVEAELVDEFVAEAEPYCAAIMDTFRRYEAEALSQLSDPG